MQNKPADSYLLRMLQGFTKPDEDWFKDLHTVQVGGATWTLASDHAALVAARGVANTAVHFITDSRRDAIEKILNSRVVLPSYVLQVDDLRSWAGPIPDTSDEVYAGYLFDVMLDQGRLARLLAPLPFPTVTVWNASTVAGMPCVGLGAKRDWFAFLAGIADCPPDGVPVFNFNDPNGQETAFELAMALEQE